MTFLVNFQKSEDDAELEGEDDAESPLPNIMQLCFQFEQAGIGLNREEMVRIWLALKTLVATQSTDKVRFWGKILGIEQNYIVAEIELRDTQDDEGEEEEVVSLKFFICICIQYCILRFNIKL